MPTKLRMIISMNGARQVCWVVRAQEGYGITKNWEFHAWSGRGSRHSPLVYCGLGGYGFIVGRFSYLKTGKNVYVKCFKFLKII